MPKLINLEEQIICNLCKNNTVYQYQGGTILTGEIFMISSTHCAYYTITTAPGGLSQMPTHRGSPKRMVNF